jgi:hypothetical protein
MDKEVACTYLRTKHGARGEEYIKEAEHGDGLAYWDYFDTIEELEADFQLYVNGGRPA